MLTAPVKFLPTVPVIRSFDGPAGGKLVLACFQTVLCQMDCLIFEIEADPMVAFLYCVPIAIPSIVSDLMALVATITRCCDVHDASEMNTSTTFFA